MRTAALMGQLLGKSAGKLADEARPAQLEDVMAVVKLSSDVSLMWPLPVQGPRCNAAPAG